MASRKRRKPLVLKPPPVVPLTPLPEGAKDGGAKLPTMKPIMHTITGGGSPHGITTYAGEIPCPYRKRLDQECRENGERTSSESLATWVGTIFHAYLELYYGGDKDAKELAASSIQFCTANGHDVETKAVMEAERLFRAYRVQFPKSEIGKVIHTEKLLPEPDDKAMKLRVEKAVGVSPYTLKIDMVIRLTKRDCDRLKTTRHIDLEPGIYLVDHKTDNARHSNYVDRYVNAQQFVAYQLAYKAAYPRVPIKGLLANICIKTKQPDFITLLAPFPSEAQQLALHNWFAGIVHIQEHLPFWQNTNACHYPYNCLHHDTGRCIRPQE